MPHHRFVPLPSHTSLPDDEMARRAASWRDELDRRRTVRHFSGKPVPRRVIESCLAAAGTAPSGANRQPWHFVAVGSNEVKRRIRRAAEQKEQDFYDHRAPEDWLEALEPLGTDENKPFLELAPWLIVVFAQLHGATEDGSRRKHYYVNESVGIATGLLISTVHRAGLVCLTHTPSPMRFLNEILGRPANERPFLLLVVGHPAEDALVPDIRRKSLEQISTFLE